MTNGQKMGRANFNLSGIGFGAFKIGRNQGIKYPQPYDLPDEATVEKLLNEILDLGITYVDTAPAYGLSEERVGKFLSHRRDEFVLSTKVGETFVDGQSTYDFSRKSLEASIERSLQLLKADHVDMLLIHSDGNDQHILEQTDAVAVLQTAKERGLTRAIGFSGKKVAGAELALNWADAVMVEYHLNDRSHEAVIEQAAQQDVVVLVKKGLAAGHLSPAEAIQFLLANSNVGSVVVGGLSIEHMKSNWQVAEEARP